MDNNLSLPDENVVARLTKLESLGLDEDDLKNLHNPLVGLTREEADNFNLFVLRTMRKPENFYLTCKYLFNIKLLPYQSVILSELWKRPFPMLIASRGAGKSFLLAVYAMLRATLMPGRKIVVTGAGFRQSKIIFNYAESIWHNSPILRHIASENQASGPHHDPDRWTMRICDSTIMCLPIGDGSRIRGERAHDIISDEFASQQREIFETVIAGFGVVSLSPLEQVEKAARKRVLKRLGRWSPAMEQRERLNSVGNQIVISGTASYVFNHFCDYWKRWKGIVESEGDPKKLAEVFGGNAPEDLDWRDYSVIRLPVDALPTGYYDPKQIARSEATLHKGIFMHEFGACTSPDALVVTDVGVKKMIDVAENDMVLTHRGRFRRVVKKTFRHYDNKIVSYRTNGFYGDNLVTPNHPFWSGGEEWTDLANVTSHTHLANLQSLSGLHDLDVSDYVETHGSVPQVIKLDYNFGVVVGYYAADGPVGGFGSDVYRLPLLMSKICPGDGRGKHILPHILYSNADFMRGFMVGYFSDDSYLYFESIALASQVRVLLSYFGITASMLCKPPCTTMTSGKGDQCEEVFIVAMDGEDRRKFREVIYDKVLSPGKALSMSNFGGCSHLPVEEKELVDYDGFVYNLEVEEDNSYSLLNATVHNCFVDDSHGFFRRSLVESCVTKEADPIVINGRSVMFNAVVRGNQNMRYVYGVDPASEQDRFSIVVLEIHPDHRRLVFCWTTTRQEHQQRIKTGLQVERDFYKFCSRKIRDLMKVFPCEHIALDSQGGGRAICEALHDPDKLESGESPLFELVRDHPLSDGKEKMTDDLPGLHIIEMVNFASAEWVATANHGLRKDFEDKAVILPAFNTTVVALSMEEDAARNRSFDTLEDCVMEIEDCKDELATIVHSQTATSNRDKWDTPEVKLPGAKKGRMRKDRYSALLMANAAARRIARKIAIPERLPYGGFVGNLKHDKEGPLYYGPDWFVKEANDHPAFFGVAVRRNGVGNGNGGSLR